MDRQKNRPTEIIFSSERHERLTVRVDEGEEDKVVLVEEAGDLSRVLVVEQVVGNIFNDLAQNALENHSSLIAVHWGSVC